MLVIIAVVTLKNDPDSIATVKAAMLDLVKESRQEEGCIRYELNEDNLELNRCLFVEQWETPELWEAHNQGTVLEKYLPKVEGLIEHTEIMQMTQIA